MRKFRYEVFHQGFEDYGLNFARFKTQTLSLIYLTQNNLKFEKKNIQFALPKLKLNLANVEFIHLTNF